MIEVLCCNYNIWLMGHPPLAQWSEQHPYKVCVTGSIPVWGTKNKCIIDLFNYKKETV